MFIPLRKIHTIELEDDYYWIIDKIAYVINSKEYNVYAVKVSRDILNFINETNFITFKQAKLIKDLKPKK